MKKSIVFGALALAGAAFAVESAVVGYENVERSDNYVFSGSMFLTPGQTSYKLNDITVSGADDEGVDFIQFLKPGTSRLNNAESYYFDGDVWCHKYNVAGVCEADDEIDDDYTIDAGNGFLARFSTVGAAFLYSGQVNAGANSVIEVPRTQNFQLVINPLPRAVDLTELTVEDADEEGADFLQFFIAGTSRLSNALSYYYDGEDWCHKYNVAGVCEADDVVEASECVILPGEGFMLRCGTAGAVVKFPAPEL